MKSINKVTLIGNVGQEPEYKEGSNGGFTTFSLATNTFIKGAEGEEPKKITDWHPIIAFGKLADIVRDFVKKGAPLYVEGQLQRRDWEDKEGNKHQAYQIKAYEVVLLGSRDDIDNTSNNQDAADIEVPF